MSGGYYDYVSFKIDAVADSIRENGAEHAAPSAVRRAFKEHLKKVAAACHAIEWNDSGDGDRDEERLVREVLSPGAVLTEAIDAAQKAAAALARELKKVEKK